MKLSLLVTASLIASFTCIAPLKAESSLGVVGELGYTCFKNTRRFHGGAFGARLNYLLNDNIGLSAAYGLNEYRSKGQAFTSQQGSAELIYQLDIFTLVPWVRLGAVAYVHDGYPLEEHSTFGISFGLGVERLLDPSWSIGASIQMQTLSDIETLPAITRMLVSLGYRWQLSNPYEP